MTHNSLIILQAVASTSRALAGGITSAKGALSSFISSFRHPISHVGALSENDSEVVDKDTNNKVTLEDKDSSEK